MIIICLFAASTFNQAGVQKHRLVLTCQLNQLNHVIPAKLNTQFKHLLCGAAWLW
jgi:hypothetical protein